MSCKKQQQLTDAKFGFTLPVAVSNDIPIVASLRHQNKFMNSKNGELETAAVVALERIFIVKKSISKTAPKVACPEPVKVIFPATCIAWLF